MAEAHKQEVIHRDLKPANVMLDTKDQPVVMDFGLARRSVDDEEKITQTGMVVGSPAYMSPEQVDAENDRVGPLADIYSLGVIFYELLTGGLPFQGRLMSILRQISMDPPRPIVDQRGDVDPVIEELCLKMLAKEASDRPASMMEVAESLSAWLEGRRSGVEESGLLETSHVPGEQLPGPEGTIPATVPGRARVEPEAESFPALADSSQIAATTHRSGGSHTPSKRKLLLGGVVLLLAGLTFFFRLGKYDVQVTLEDPSITLSVDDGALIVSGTDSDTIRLTDGPHKLTAEIGDLTAELDEFTVKKDGKNAVHVAILEGKPVFNPTDKLVVPRDLPTSNPKTSAPPPNVVKAATPSPSEGQAVAARQIELLTSPAYEWTRPVNLGPEINSKEKENHPTVSGDGLVLIFESGRDSNSMRLFESRRSSTDEPWALARPIDELNQVKATDPHLSRDGLSLLFAGPHEGKQKLWLSHRSTRDAVWQEPVDPGPEVNSGGKLWGGELSPDGLTLYFKRRAENARNFALWRTHRSTVTAPWEKATRLESPVNSNSFLDGVQLLADGKSLLIARSDGANFLARRNAAGKLESQGVKTNFHFINFTLTDSGSLIFTWSRTDMGFGDRDLWMSRRVRKADAPAPPSATGSASTPPPAVAPFDEAQAKTHQKAWAKDLGVPVEKVVELRDRELIRFVLVPPGEFKMGSTEEERRWADAEAKAAGDTEASSLIRTEQPLHTVRITRPFYLAESELTNSQWMAIVPGNFSYAEKGLKHPLGRVSWDIAGKVVDGLNELRPEEGTFRLPTEAEWEYACRAGSADWWAHGSDPAQLEQFAWYVANAKSKPREVKTRTPNAFGLHDMHGNVWEWCEDGFQSDFYERSDVADPCFCDPQIGVRVHRGGCCLSDAETCRSARRFGYPQSRRNSVVGMRVALQIDLPIASK